MNNTEDHKCGHPVGKCEILKTSEITPNGFNVVIDKYNHHLCHVLQYKDPIEIINALIKSAETTKKFCDIYDYKIMKMELEANNRNLLSMTEFLQASTSNDEIQAVIDAHKNNKCGCDKLDYADDLVIMTLEKLLKGG